MANCGQRWDVFVSHNRRQKSWVREMVSQLRDLGLRVFFDEDSIRPGTDFVGAMEQAITTSRYVVLVVSPSALASRWVAMETALALHQDPEATEGRLIPLILEPVEEADLRPSLRRLRWVDLTSPDRATSEYRYFLEALGVPEDAVLCPPDLSEMSAALVRTERPLVLAAMGVKGGVGKTSVMCAMAELTAHTGKNVLIVDADLESAGMTEYMRTQVRGPCPHVWTVMDACFEKQARDAETVGRDMGLWDITPGYLRKEQFGRIYLVPGRRQGETRIAYEAMADISPAERNQAALEVLQEMMGRAAEADRPVDAILIDCGAENNPLVSAGVVLADCAYAVSHPRPEFGHKVPVYEQMHRKRYPERLFNEMSIVVNQAAPDTRQKWRDFPGAYFVREDSVYRRSVASGKMDFEGVGLCNMYHDVLRIMLATFGSQHQHMLPDQKKIWVEPYIRGMKGFPEAALKQKRYRLLPVITGAIVLLGLLFISGAIRHYTNTTIQAQVAIERPAGVSDDSFQRELQQIKIAPDLADRTRLEGTTLVLQGTVTEKELASLRTASQYGAYLEALSGAATETENRQYRLVVTVLVLVCIGIGVVAVAGVVHRRLRNQKRLLMGIQRARAEENREPLTQLVTQLMPDEEKDPRLHWLRHQFRRWLILDTGLRL